MDDKVIYRDKNDNMLLFNIMYYYNGYAIYEVGVRSHGFAGHHNFCIEEHEIEGYLKCVEKMRLSLSGDIWIADDDSNSGFQIFFENDRRCYVEGQIGGTFNDNYVCFKFEADQTVLSALKCKLNEYKYYT